MIVDLVMTKYSLKENNNSHSCQVSGGSFIAWMCKIPVKWKKFSACMMEVMSDDDDATTRVGWRKARGFAQFHKSNMTDFGSRHGLTPTISRLEFLTRVSDFKGYSI